MTNPISETKGRVFLLLGMALVVGGFVCNEWVLARAFSDDGLLIAATRIKIAVFDLVLMGLGALLLVNRSQLSARLDSALGAYSVGQATLIACGTATLMIFIVEGGLYGFIALRHWSMHIDRQDTPFAAGSAVPGSLKVGDETIFDVTYTLDDKKRRVTASHSLAETDNVIVFFGGSFTFGTGVEDDETLPSEVAKSAPRWHVTNLGFGGRGPSHMYLKLKDPATLEEFTGKNVKLIYVFIPPHVRRSIGAMRTAAAWGRNFPYLVRDGADGFLHRGTFTTGRPWTSWLYAFISREAILRYNNVDIPLRVTDAHRAFVADIVAAARDRFEAQFPNGQFYVVLFPKLREQEFSATQMIAHLHGHGLATLDYTQFLNGDVDDYWFRFDPHPKPKAYAELAAQLARDIGVDSGPAPG